jgi:hypothetical protein
MITILQFLPYKIHERNHRRRLQSAYDLDGFPSNATPILNCVEA